MIYYIYIQSRVQSGVKPKEIPSSGTSQNHLILNLAPTTTQIAPIRLQTRIVNDGFKELRDSLESVCSTESGTQNRRVNQHDQIKMLKRPKSNYNMTETRFRIGLPVKQKLGNSEKKMMSGSLKKGNPNQQEFASFISNALQGGMGIRGGPLNFIVRGSASRNSKITGKTPISLTYNPATNSSQTKIRPNQGMIFGSAIRESTATPNNQEPYSPAQLPKTITNRSQKIIVNMNGSNSVQQARSVLQPVRQFSKRQPISPTKEVYQEFFNSTTVESQEDSKKTLENAQNNVGPSDDYNQFNDTSFLRLKHQKSFEKYYFHPKKNEGSGASSPNRSFKKRRESAKENKSALVIEGGTKSSRIFLMRDLVTPQATFQNNYICAAQQKMPIKELGSPISQPKPQEPLNKQSAYSLAALCQLKPRIKILRQHYIQEFSRQHLTPIYLNLDMLKNFKRGLMVFK